MMDCQDAQAIRKIIGLGACCDSCAKGGPCEGETGLAQTNVEHLALPAYQHGAMRMGPVWPVGMPTRVRRGFGADPMTAGDYHVVGEGVTLRARPEAGSQPIAALQNGEGVYVFGDVETDYENMIGPQGTAIPNDGKSPGIVYTRIGTQHHGAGFVAVKFLAQGAGNQVQPQSRGVPDDFSNTFGEKKGMSLVSKVLLGGAIVATVAGGAFMLGKAISESQFAHA